MCDTCGCGNPEKEVKISKPGGKSSGHGHSYRHSHRHTHGGEEHSHGHPHGYTHSHDHTSDHTHEENHPVSHSHDDHGHDHEHPEAGELNHEHTGDRKILLEKDIMSQNNLLAARNRGYFEAKGILAINLVSSPGSGKTSLLEKTIHDLKKEISIYVVEGDQQTMNDAERIHKTGAPVVQINTGEGCHLDADMLMKAVRELEPADHSLLMVENVGNLVCPALFDLGESFRVVVISVTEGDDKPVKYPYMFQTSDLCIINKTDLLPYVDFNVEKAKEYARQIKPGLRIIEVSVKTGEGMTEWYEWLRYVMGGTSFYKS